MGFTQLINEPTRLTPTTASILDHVIVNTNLRDKVKEHGVIDVGFSDHLITYCSRGINAMSLDVSNFKFIRSFRDYSPLKLNRELSKISWSNLLQSTDVNYCLAEFTRLFNSAVDVVAPSRRVRVRSRSSPWMNAHILSGIKLRDSLFSRFKRDRTNLSLYSDYCRIRNSVQRDIRFAKQSFFRAQVEEHKSNSDKLWNQLKTLGYKSKSNASSIVLDKDGTKVFDPFSVASIFNQFYSTVASDLVSKLPMPSGLFDTSSYAFRSFYRRLSGSSTSFTLSPVSRGFILKQLRSLNPHKAIGLDGISPRLLRDSADAIMEPVSHIINISILTETVPASFKQAKVVPLFKKGNRSDPGNYRPVSVLNVLSKVLERAVQNQLSEYLTKKNILSSHQSGFRSRYSTDTCLIHLSDYVKNEISNGNFVGMVFLDLRKAFDTVNHVILLSKLSAIGVSSVSWFQSYLGDREQCVEVSGRRSDFLNMSCGVPQGSILGPLLFLIYINDLSISVNCGLSLYADDSALIYAHKDPKLIGEHLSLQLTSCQRWLIDNRLSLHVGKTEAILFGTGRRLKRAEGFEVTCDGAAVKQVTSVKYLGVILNSCMDGKAHAENVLRQCAGRLSFLYRNAFLMDFSTRKILCSALIQPYLDYCASSWYGCLTQHLKLKLDILQRKMVRFVFSLGHMDHVDSSDFKKLSWLVFSDRVKFFRLCHVFKIKTGNAPSYLIDSFVPLSETHSYGTRGSTSNDFSVARCEGASKSFSLTAILDWNRLPASVRQCQSLLTFKGRLKLLLFNSY